MDAKKYLILLVDRKRARMFTIFDGAVVNHKEISNDEAPKRVKHGENSWDAQDKIDRHIEDHLHRHLNHVSQEVINFVKNEKINGIIIGSHKPLFKKIEKHLKYPYSNKVLGHFVIEFKVTQVDVFRRAKKLIESIEQKKLEEQLQHALQ